MTMTMTIKTIDPTVKPYIYTDKGKEFDWPFIYATWVASYKVSQTAFLCRSLKEYEHYQREIIKSILEMPTTTIRCVRLEGDSDSIITYVVMDKSLQCLHYCYTKFDYRKCALAQNLVLGSNLVYTSSNRAVNHKFAGLYQFRYENLMPWWGAHLRFHPYLLLDIVKAKAKI
jgi:hypothetical protein